MSMRITLLAMVLVVLLTAGVAAFSIGYVIQTADDNAVLIRMSTESQLTVGTQLLADDVIQGDLSKIHIKLHPNAKLKQLGGNKHLVVFATQEENGFVNKLAAFFGFVKHEAQDVDAATRNPADILFSPGKSAGVIPGQPIRFKWIEANGQSLVITDNKGKEVFREYVGGNNQYTMSPEQTNKIFIPGNRYQWEITGQQLAMNELYVPDKERLDKITVDIRNISDNSNILSKIKIDFAIYLTLFSDTQPPQQQLYWLAMYQLSQVPSEDVDIDLWDFVQKRYYETLFR